MYGNYIRLKTKEGIVEAYVNYHGPSNSYNYLIIFRDARKTEQRSFGNGVDALKARDDRLLELMVE